MGYSPAETLVLLAFVAGIAFCVGYAVGGGGRKT